MEHDAMYPRPVQSVGPVTPVSSSGISITRFDKQLTIARCLLGFPHGFNMLSLVPLLHPTVPIPPTHICIIITYIGLAGARIQSMVSINKFYTK